MAREEGSPPPGRLGTAICSAFGLDANKLRSLTLRICVGEIPYLELEQYIDKLDDGALGELATVLSRYRLEEVTDG